MKPAYASIANLRVQAWVDMLHTTGICQPQKSGGLAMQRKCVAASPAVLQLLELVLGEVALGEAQRVKDAAWVPEYRSIACQTKECRCSNHGWTAVLGVNALGAVKGRTPGYCHLAASGWRRWGPRCWTLGSCSPAAAARRLSRCGQSYTD